MKRIVASLVCLLSASAMIQAQIIPAPASLKRAAGEFVYDASTAITTDQPKHKAVQFLSSYLKRSLGKTAGKTVIELSSKGADNLPPEGYALTITPKKVTIVGRDAGLFYGIQSFLQLLPADKKNTFKLPCLEIKDQPRFGYRGMMLDVSRHFFTVAEVKEFIDLMAAYKLNRFHWHLVDNEGWRIEIKKYPKLTQVGGFRQNHYILGNRDWPDNTSYGGFYTQEQIREVVQYAADRFITVVPEIELPAHSAAALRAYPEYKCEMAANTKDANAYNIIFCPTEAAFQFFEDVFTEVFPLFPGEYIHIGGDEANKQPWKESAFCQDLIKKLNLKDENGLQSYFISRMEKFLNSKGKSIIGWDEILEGGLAPNATVMSWRGEEGGIAAAKQKHNVIMTPATNGLYFDYAQSTSDMEPMTFGSVINRNSPLEQTYSYDPVPSSLSKEEQQYIIGVQANLWTEAIGTRNKLQYMIIPRVFAIAELGWTMPANKNYSNLVNNHMPVHLDKLETKGYHFRVPTALGAVDTTLFGSEFTFDLKPSVEGATIYYTLNGRIPTDLDLIYKDPLQLMVPPNEKRELQTIVITAGGRRSVATRTVLMNREPNAAVNYSTNRPGLQYKIYKQFFTTAEQVLIANATDSGTVNDFNLRRERKPMGIVYEGFLRVDTAGVYHFSLAGQSGSLLFIDDEKLVDNDRAATRFEKKGALPLAAGFHKIKLVYYDARGNGYVQVKMGRAGAPETDIPANKLYY
jgi:N-acetyl-beta-hexosaminidase